MNLRIAIAHRFIPISIRRAKLKELIHLTADAFGSQPPDLEGLSPEEMLISFARFCHDQVNLRPDEARKGFPIQRRLYGNAFRFGTKLRRYLRPRNEEEYMAALRIIYRMIGIDLRGDRTGSIRVRTCLFSEFFDPFTCRVIEALDQGVTAGLWGGGRLEFTGRITEGKENCLAGFSFQRGTE